MNIELGDKEFRWQIVKAMLDEYPALREKTETYLKTQKR